MATLESDKVHTALSVKLGCETDMTKRDHDWYLVKESEIFLSSTFMSKGSKHTLNAPLVSKMAKQLKLGGAGNLVKLVDCTLSKEECLAIIRDAAGVRPTPGVKPASGAKPAAVLKPKSR